MITCPVCRREVQEGLVECPFCGVIFAKWRGDKTAISVQPPPAVDQSPLTQTNKPTGPREIRSKKLYTVAGLLFVLLACGLWLGYQPASLKATAAVTLTGQEANPKTTAYVSLTDEEAEGLRHRAAKRDLQALKTLRDAADKGDPSAQYQMGLIYSVARGSRKWDEERVKWYSKAAGQGHPLAQFEMGAMYMDGDGVLKNEVEAVKWFRKSAEQGYVKAQYNLGVMYASGRGVPKDGEESAKWLLKAAEQGDSQAQAAIAYINVLSAQRKELGQ